MAVTRRGFLTAAAATGSLVGWVEWATLSQAVAAETRLDPARVRYSPEIDELVGLLRATPADQCFAVFLGKLRQGMSYQSFLATVFLAAIEEGDPHQVAQVYSAHRIASDARVEERLLPLFWALERVKGGLDSQQQRPAPLADATLPSSEAAAAFDRAFAAGDAELAEQAVAALAAANGPRHAMSRLWLWGTRRVAGTLGHHPIIIANAWRTLEAMGWQHAEPALRYMARYFPRFESDASFEANRQRASRTREQLPAGWAADTPNRAATLELYALLRSGQGDNACELICRQLAQGEASAGAAWDAIHLTAADLLVRYEVGGGPIGGSLIHDVTSTNALRYGFDACDDDTVRLVLLLQAASSLCEAFVLPAVRDNRLRPLNLLELTAAEQPAMNDVFVLLPWKSSYSEQKSTDERAASDQACRVALGLVQQEPQARAFQQTARSLLCRKATSNPHDFKYVAAAFEDAERANAQWRPFLLASSVHALHGTQSDDAAALVALRERLS